MGLFMSPMMSASLGLLFSSVFFAFRVSDVHQSLSTINEPSLFFVILLQSFCYPLKHLAIISKRSLTVVLERLISFSCCHLVLRSLFFPINHCLYSIDCIFQEKVTIAVEYQHPDDFLSSGRALRDIRLGSPLSLCGEVPTSSALDCELFHRLVIHHVSASAFATVWHY